MKKILIIITCVCILFVSFITYNRITNIGYLPVLGYHSVVSDEIKSTTYKDDHYTISESTFIKHLDYLKDNNYYTLTMNEVIDYYFSHTTLPNNAVFITFDDGHDDLYNIDQILQEYDFVASAFIIGSKIGTVKTTGNFDYITLDQMNETTNIEYYSHTYNLHRYDGNYKILETASVNTILEDHYLMESLVNNNIVAYPYGVSSDNAIEAYKQANVVLAFNYNNFSNLKPTSDQYNLPRYMITDITPLWYLKWIVG